MKELFPVYEKNKDLCYLDSAASALKPKVVIDAINDYYVNYSCNIDRGVYKLSLDATSICNESREKVAKFINADYKEVIFTRGCSNSLNTVCLMLKKVLKKGDEIITSHLEHHSNFLPWLNLSKEIGCKIVFVELENNKITVENVKKAITKNTKLIALTHVSNVLGYVTPIKEIVEVAHKNNILVSVDGAQAIPHMKIDVKALDVDFYSFSFHKLCGPTGLGVLYGKEKLLNMLDPVELGGEMNDEVSVDSVTYKEIPHKFETGTMPIAEIFGASKTIDFINSIGIENIEKTSLELAKFVKDELKKIKEIEIYNDLELSSIISFNIKGVHSHDSVTALSEKGIALRAGHHCAEPLHKYLNINASLRASFYFYNDLSDCEKFINAVKEVVGFFKEVGYIG